MTDELDNLITSIPQALTRTGSAGTGTVITQGGLLSWPLAMVMTPQGHLLVCNGKDGRLVEVDPASRTQIYAQWINNDQAQSPPGNGDLFGIALTPDAKGFYYVMGRCEFHHARRQPVTGRCPFSPTRRGMLGAAAGLAALGGARLAGAADHPPLIKTASAAKATALCLSTARGRTASSRRNRATPISPPSTSRPKSAATSSRCCNAGPRPLPA